jgi:predicted phage tail component-like protein
MTTTVSIAGVALSNYAKIIDVRRDLLPPRTLITEKLSQRPGAYLFGKTDEPRVHEVDIYFIENDWNTVTATAQSLATLLDTDEVVPITYGDKPGVTYYGILFDETPITDRVKHTGKVTLKLFLPDPCGYGPEVVYQMGSETATFAVAGNRDPEPIIEAEFTEDTPFFLATQTDDTKVVPADFGAENPALEKFLLVGEPEGEENPVVPVRQRILRDHLFTMSGWSAGSNTDVDGTATGSMTIGNIEFGGFTAADFGTPSNEYHGPVLKKTLSETVSDFEFHAWFEFRSFNGRMGKTEVYLYDTNGVPVVKLGLRDRRTMDDWTIGEVRLGGLGGKRMLWGRPQPPNAWQRFYGRIMVKRVGNRWEYMVSKQNTTTREHHTIRRGSWTDKNNDYSNNVAQIGIYVAQWKEIQPSHLVVRAVHMFKINSVNTNETGSIFLEDDVLTLDCERGQVLKNGVLYMTELDPTSDFFKLKAGALNTVGVMPADKAVVKIRYRPKWI